MVANIHEFGKNYAAIWLAACTWMVIMHFPEFVASGLFLGASMVAGMCQVTGEPYIILMTAVTSPAVQHVFVLPILAMVGHMCFAKVEPRHKGRLGGNVYEVTHADYDYNVFNVIGWLYLLVGIATCELFFFVNVAFVLVVAQILLLPSTIHAIQQTTWREILRTFLCLQGQVELMILSEYLSLSSLQSPTWNAFVDISKCRINQIESTENLARRQRINWKRFGTIYVCIEMGAFASTAMLVSPMFFLCCSLPSALCLVWCCPPSCSMSFRR